MSNFDKDEQCLDDQFQRMFEFTPFAFQRKVAQHLLNGRNVILQAPTGAGKTKAALFPFLLAQQGKHTISPEATLRHTNAGFGKKFSHRFPQNTPIRETKDSQGSNSDG